MVEVSDGQSLHILSNVNIYTQKKTLETHIEDKVQCCTDLFKKSKIAKKNLKFPL